MNTAKVQALLLEAGALNESTKSQTIKAAIQKLIEAITELTQKPS